MFKKYINNITMNILFLYKYIVFISSVIRVFPISSLLPHNQSPGPLKRLGRISFLGQGRWKI